MALAKSAVPVRAVYNVGMIHQTAAQGFLAAERYDQARPEYPGDAVARLVAEMKLTACSCVVELGAGTGKFTRLLAAAMPAGARLIAVEPVAEMRRRLTAVLPAIEAADGAAERIPLPDGMADAVVAAQAFHWFDYARARPEICRVLKPGGRLGLIWNIRDDGVGWVARLEEITEAYSGVSPRYLSGQWRRAIEESGRFSALGSYESHYPHIGPPEAVVERVATSSYIARLDEEKKQRVLGRVRQLLAGHPQTAGRAEVAFPYRTPVYWCSVKD